MTKEQFTSVVMMMKPITDCLSSHDIAHTKNVIHDEGIIMEGSIDGSYWSIELFIDLDLVLLCNYPNQTIRAFDLDLLYVANAIQEHLVDNGAYGLKHQRREKINKLNDE